MSLTGTWLSQLQLAKCLSLGSFLMREEATNYSLRGLALMRKRLQILKGQQSLALHRPCAASTKMQPKETAFLAQQEQSGNLLNCGPQTQVLQNAHRVHSSNRLNCIHITCEHAAAMLMGYAPNIYAVICCARCLEACSGASGGCFMIGCGSWTGETMDITDGLKSVRNNTHGWLLLRVWDMKIMLCPTDGR